MVEMMFLMAGDWSYIKNTATHLGADFVSDKFVIECKNWNPLLYIRTQQFYDAVLVRFLVLDPDHTKRWILIIPKLWELDNFEVSALIDEYNIQVVQTGLQYSRPRLNIVEYLFNEIYHQEETTLYLPEPAILVCDEQVLPSYPILDQFSSFAEAEFDFWNSISCDVLPLDSY